MSVTSVPRVMIAGGGLGGLALAQGLVGAGVDVVVFERDQASASRLQGYRLSLSPDGLGALKALLPQASWQEVVSACTAPLQGIAFVSQRLETRFFKKTPDPEGETRRYVSVSRITLRKVLLCGIEDRVQFGRCCTSYRLQDDGRVACHFANGDSEIGDVLIGAEGTRSVIREQLLAVSNRYETGISAVAGKVPIEGDPADALTAPPIGECAVVIGDAPQGLFIADHQLVATHRGGRYIFWSFVTARNRFPEAIDRASPERLVQIVDEMTPDWHPRLKDLIRRALTDSILLVNFDSSHRPASWHGGPVTLIGDAIHNMPPTGGEGANMALKDAATLRDALLFSGSSPLHELLAHYQNRMLDYAFKAVATSMSNLDRMVKREQSRTQPL